VRRNIAGAKYANGLSDLSVHLAVRRGLNYSEEVLRAAFSTVRPTSIPVMRPVRTHEDALADSRYLIAGELMLDRADERAWRGRSPVRLGGKAFLLLRALMECPQTLVTKDELFEAAWPGLAVSESVLTTAIKEIRQAIGDKARSPQMIETVHGRGYRFLLPVEARDEQPPATAKAPRRRLKPIWIAVAAAVLVAVSLPWLWMRLGNGSVSELTFHPHPQSIAVLPFKDFSPAHDQQWFAAGMTEEILNSLARTPDLRVAARTSTEGIEEGDMRTIGRKLNVAYVLEGSLRREGQRVRVTAQLIRSRDGIHLWSQDYDRNASEVIDIQEQIAIAIARSLKTVMTPDKLAAMVSLGTRSVDAYEEYLRGLAYQRRALETGDSSNSDNAYAAFEHARQLDPQFAAAHWQAAARFFSRATRVGSAAAQSDQNEQGRLHEYLVRVDAAISSSEGRPEQLRYRSARALVDYHFRDAVNLMRAYLQQRPRELDAWDEMVNLAGYVGDRPLMADAARRIHDQSVESGRPLSRAITASVLALDIDNAVKRSRQQLAMRPGETLIQYQAHRALLWGGHRDDARALLGRINQSSLPDENKLLAQLRQACADGGQGALAIAARIDSDKRTSTSTRWQAWMLMGDQSRAYALLKPLDQPDRLPTLVQYMVYPDFDARLFPLLQSKLDDDEVRRPAPVQAPYTCRAAIR
jgi:TolB-like protein/DNA-binding winged helix-turn-helix (wHTH) protein